MEAEVVKRKMKPKQDYSPLRQLEVGGYLVFKEYVNVCRIRKDAKYTCEKHDGGYLVTRVQ
jgi:hypothetical protein